MKKFERLIPLLGRYALDTLNKKSVIVFGLGGVGGYVVEALCRSGITNLTLVDNDTIAESNINRQILATTSTIGLQKTEVAKNRILDINPSCKVTCYNTFFLPNDDTIKNWDEFDYIVDAIDTVTAKIELCQIAKDKNIPIISCLGTGNKLHPELLEVSTIEKTSVCPLARVMRRELAKRDITNVKVVYSTEKPITNAENLNYTASFIAVPATAGLLIATTVITDLIKL
ncbi:MAG: ThiF family adenylyltransferase [Clostridia bacterium]